MFKERNENLSSYVHVLHKTSHWKVSPCSRAVNIKEMSKKRDAVVLLIKPIDLFRLFFFFSNTGQLIV